MRVSLTMQENGNVWAFLVPSKRARSGDQKRLSGGRPDNLPDWQKRTRVKPLNIG